MSKASRRRTITDEIIDLRKEKKKQFGALRQSITGISAGATGAIGSSGGSTAGSQQAAGVNINEFPDSVFRIFDDSNAAIDSKLEFNVNGVPDNTTVTWFVSGESGILCFVDSGVTQLFSNNIKFIVGSTALEMNDRPIILDADSNAIIGSVFEGRLFFVNLSGSTQFTIQTSPPKVDVRNKKIENVLDPVLDLDAVNLRTLNQRLQEIVIEFHDIIRVFVGISESATFDIGTKETSTISASVTIIIPTRESATIDEHSIIIVTSP